MMFKCFVCSYRSQLWSAVQGFFKEKKRLKTELSCYTNDLQKEKNDTSQTVNFLLYVKFHSSWAIWVFSAYAV